MSTHNRDPKNVAQAYVQASVENAPPVKIVRLLYEGALRFLDRASAAGAANAMGEFTRWITRADAIVNELRASLDHGHDANVSGELDRLYVFVQERLARAIVDKDPELVAGARVVLATLLEGWKAVELQAGATQQR